MGGKRAYGRSGGRAWIGRMGRRPAGMVAGRCLYIDTGVAPGCGSARNNCIPRITVILTSRLQRSLAAPDPPVLESASWLPSLFPQSRYVARRATTLPIPYPTAVPRRPDAPPLPIPAALLIYIEAALLHRQSLGKFHAERDLVIRNPPRYTLLRLQLLHLRLSHQQIVPEEA